jgi:hypothetical protein
MPGMEIDRSGGVPCLSWSEAETALPAHETVGRRREREADDFAAGEWMTAQVRGKTEKTLEIAGFDALLMLVATGRGRGGGTELHALRSPDTLRIWCRGRVADPFDCSLWRSCAALSADGDVDIFS